MDKFTDSTIMTFGQYKGKPLYEIPISYLEWYKSEQEKNPTWHPDKKALLEYIDRVLLKSEIMGCLPSEYIKDSITAGRIANNILDVLKQFNLIK